MPKFAANLSMLFTEAPFLDRFALARECGFTYVEYLFPYDVPAAELKRRLDDNGLRQVLFNLPSGDWPGGERGIGANPNRVEEFRTGVSKAVEYALALGVPTLNALAGKRVPGVDDATMKATYVANLKFAARALAAKGLRLVMEPINHFDIPGFFLNRTDQALAILAEVDDPNLAIQYDVYHAQREEGELVNTLRNHLARIGHIQIADNPGRHQPGTGEINYPFVFKEMDRLGYQGYVGLEYVPTPDSRSSFAWIKEMGY
jgi:hydroxypyruvate isomerase